MMHLIWLRHGESVANRERRYCGHLDTPLTVRGRRQAEAAFRRLSARIRPDRICISDRSRCEETAALWLMKHPSVPVMRTAALRELSFGMWEGKTYDDLLASDGDRLQAWIDSPWQVAPPGGETLEELGRRLTMWWQDLLQRDSDKKTVLIISHGGPIRWFYASLVLRDPGRFWDCDIPPGRWIRLWFNDGKWEEETG